LSTDPLALLGYDALDGIRNLFQGCRSPAGIAEQTEEFLHRPREQGYAHGTVLADRKVEPVSRSDAQVGSNLFGYRDLTFAGDR